MNPALWVACLVPVASVLGVIITQRMARGAQREMYPSQVIKDLSDRLDKTDGRLDASLRRERLRDNYIHDLRDHISRGNPPPPPPWPPGLTT